MLLKRRVEKRRERSSIFSKAFVFIFIDIHNLDENGNWSSSKKLELMGSDLSKEKGQWTSRDSWLLQGFFFN